MSRLLLVAALTVLLAACQVDIGIDLDLDADGSGTVAMTARFDDEALQVLGDLEERVGFDDAERAGWDISVEPDENGGATLVAAKLVADESQWQGVLDDIVGPGVFTNVVVVADEDGQRLAFDLDLSDGWSLLADEDITAALDGEPFGAPIDELTEGRSIDEIVNVDLDVSVRNLQDGIPAIESFSPRFDDARPLSVNVVASVPDSTADLVRWISMSLFFLFALATVLAITGVVLQRRSDRLRPPPTPAPLASRVPGRALAESAGSTGPAPSRRSQTVRLVVIEPLSVLYRQPRVLEDVVLPFVRDHDGTARVDTIENGYASLLAGAMDTSAFWELCGVDGDADALDDELVAGRELHPGTRGFFDEMQRRRIPVAATTDDAAAWSTRTRERDRLRSVWPWLVSSDVGTRSSNAAMFEVLRRESSVAYSHCLYVDSDIDRLDAARDLGMKTALLDTGDLDLPAVIGHPVITDLTALIRSES